MQFHCGSFQGVERANENKKEFKVVRCHGVFDIVSNPNGHIPLCGGQVLFDLTHTFWGINKFMCL
jgi:rRNA maturation endonuclease Nob1